MSCTSLSLKDDKTHWCLYKALTDQTNSQSFVMQSNLLLHYSSLYYWTTQLCLRHAFRNPPELCYSYILHKPTTDADKSRLTQTALWFISKVTKLTSMTPAFRDRCISSLPEHVVQWKLNTSRSCLLFKSLFRGNRVKQLQKEIITQDNVKGDWVYRHYI